MLQEIETNRIIHNQKKARPFSIRSIFFQVPGVDFPTFLFRLEKDRAVPLLRTSFEKASSDSVWDLFMCVFKKRINHLKFKYIN